MIEFSQVLPRPGCVWGHYPQRAADDRSPPWHQPHWRRRLARCRSVARAAQAQADAWCVLPASERAGALASLRRQLRREGLRHDAHAQALGAAAVCAAETLGWVPRPTQLLAAAAMLDGCMAEMATGEGKTLAIALAAAVAALAGMPVHVVTANEYLARRDATRLAPLFAALGLSTVARAGAPAQSDDGARTIYAHDIVYATAKDLAFDFLRDRQCGGAASELERHVAGLAGEPVGARRMRGLCLALLDEADSILLDEAEVPLILSRAAPQAARRAFLWQALALARQLEGRRDFALHHADRLVTLEPAGEEHLARVTTGLGGPWQRPRYRREAIELALAALHLFRKDEHYLVREGHVELLDEVTGRVAAGRVWSRGLHTLVALKEGLAPPAETETVAQTTFQRYFQRYWRLCGVSGTLWEARVELRQVYGTPVLRIPLHRPCQRKDGPPRSFDTAEAMLQALVERVSGLVATGRPVLVGTDSVADSSRISQCLRDAGVAHHVLNALHDADEATIIARAGQASQVTVATRMAGRGTDIELDAAARRAGGLHALCCQDNFSRRLDRQFAGRAGRHGDPGSTEAWFSPPLFATAAAPAADKVASWNIFHTILARPQWMLLQHRWHQWREQVRRAARRRELLEQDLHWERRLSFAGPQR